MPWSPSFGARDNHAIAVLDDEAALELLRNYEESYMIAYSLSVILSWLSLLFMVVIHASRIIEGKSLGAFGVAISVAGFCVSFPYYVLGIRSASRFFHHILYWTPILLAIALGMILTVTFAP